MSVLLQNGNQRFGDTFHQARGYDTHLSSFEYLKMTLRTNLQPQSGLAIELNLN
jgi:hypothetical protein